MCQAPSSKESDVVKCRSTIDVIGWITGWLCTRLCRGSPPPPVLREPLQRSSPIDVQSVRQADTAKCERERHRAKRERDMFILRVLCTQRSDIGESVSIESHIAGARQEPHSRWITP